VSNHALIVGSSDGIGLELCRELLKREWQVFGISRSKSPLKDSRYKHYVSNVTSQEFKTIVKEIINNGHHIDLCVYCAGIGELLDLSDMSFESEVFKVNLLGLIDLASIIIPVMVKVGQGHFIGISSVADAMLSPEAPSYHASKAGFSNYLESLALALREKGVFVSNIRFGFVETKMAKGDIKPFMMSVHKAVSIILYCINNKMVRVTRPRIIIPLIAFRNRILKLKNQLGN
jgi:short-subunit dehydrogenase